MPPQTSREVRVMREASEALQAGLDRYSRGSRALQAARLERGDAWTRAVQEATAAREALQAQFRVAEEAIDRHREASQQARSTVDTGSPLFLNRATTLLACICLVRFQKPHWTDHDIVHVLRDSFPEIFIRTSDIDVLFRATCLNRPGWVLDMHHSSSVQQRSMAHDLLNLLHTDMLAHLLQLPPGHYQDRREGIRYLENLVGVRDGNVVRDRDREIEIVHERQW